jgi:NAD(P)H-dependent FMN reductase
MDAPKVFQTTAWDPTKIRSADAFIFVVGEYNWSVQPESKELD